MGDIIWGSRDHTRNGKERLDNGKDKQREIQFNSKNLKENNNSTVKKEAATGTNDLSDSTEES